MEKNLKDYLEWRFRTNNHPKYLKYCGQWIKNLLPDQLSYFEKERTRLLNNGVYH